MAARLESRLRRLPKQPEERDHAFSQTVQVHAIKRRPPVSAAQHHLAQGSHTRTVACTYWFFTCRLRFIAPDTRAHSCWSLRAAPSGTDSGLKRSQHGRLPVSTLEVRFAAVGRMACSGHADATSLMRCACDPRKRGCSPSMGHMYFALVQEIDIWEPCARDPALHCKVLPLGRRLGAQLNKSASGWPLSSSRRIPQSERQAR